MASAEQHHILARPTFEAPVKLLQLSDKQPRFLDELTATGVRDYHWLTTGVHDAAAAGGGALLSSASNTALALHGVEHRLACMD